MTPEQREFIDSLDRDGTLTPATLEEAARPRQSPIHDLFTWDSKVGAYRWRLQEARELIGRVRVEYVKHVREVRSPVYVRDPDVPKKEQGYVRVGLLRTRGDSAREALEYELARVAALVARTRAIAAELGRSSQCEDRLAVILAPPMEEAG